MFLLSLVTGIAGIYFLGQQESLDSATFTFIERVLVGSYSLVIYIVKSVMPFELLPIYPYPKTGQFVWYFYLMPVIIVVLAVIVGRQVKKAPALVFGILFFFVNIVFVLQFVTAGQGFMADRFSYMPYIGLFYFYTRGDRISLQQSRHHPHRCHGGGLGSNHHLYLHKSAAGHNVTE